MYAVQECQREKRPVTTGPTFRLGDLGASEQIVGTGH